MASLFRKLISLISPTAEPGESVYLGAFGKHPAWDDHIDDIGLVTEHLAAVKRTLYIDGIGGNIDAGSWDALEKNNNAIPFDHAFVWRRSPTEIVVGRLWASRDGKGRSRYPMVICAEFHGPSITLAMNEILPALESLKAKCIGATDASTVRALLGGAQQELRARFETQRNAPISVPDTALSSDGSHRRGVSSGSTTVLLGPSAASALAASFAAKPEMSPGGRGMLSVLYQIDREMAAYARPTLLCPRPQESTIMLSGGSTSGPQPLRVPPCDTKMEVGARRWIELAMELLDDETPVLAIWSKSATSSNGRWIDLIVGEPAAHQLQCIRASKAAMPFTTEIPYTLDPTFLARASAYTGRSFDMADLTDGHGSERDRSISA